MIPVFKPSLGNEELMAVKEVFDSGWIGLGPKTREFEEKFAEYIGIKFAIGTNSCTAALHLALKAMKINNREVITSPLTFVSTNHAILYNGGIPVFADICEDTLNLDVNDIKKKITPKTKAIIVVHYGGHPCDMAQISSLARKKGIKVIEDAAHATGASYNDRNVGTLGDIACFSFHAVKNLTTGEGGMITTADEKVYHELMKLRWLGINKDTWQRSDNKFGRYGWYYEVESLGFKYHMSDINAAIGLVQLEKLERLNARRRQIASMYNKEFKGVDWITVPVVKNGVICAHHNYVIKVDLDRNKLIEYLKAKDIATSVHYIPNHRYKMYRKYKAKVPVVDRVWEKLVTLPLFPGLTNDQVGYIASTVKGFNKKRGCN